MGAGRRATPQRRHVHGKSRKTPVKHAWIFFKRAPTVTTDSPVDRGTPLYPPFARGERKRVAPPRCSPLAKGGYRGVNWLSTPGWTQRNRYASGLDSSRRRDHLQHGALRKFLIVTPKSQRRPILYSEEIRLRATRRKCGVIGRVSSSESRHRNRSERTRDAHRKSTILRNASIVRAAWDFGIEIARTNPGHRCIEA